MTADLSLDALEQIAKAAKNGGSALTEFRYQFSADVAVALIAAARAKSPEPRPAGEEVAGLVGEIDAWLSFRKGGLSHADVAGLMAKAAKALSTLSAERDAMEGALKWIAEHDNHRLSDGSSATRTCIDAIVQRARDAI